MMLSSRGSAPPTPKAGGLESDVQIVTPPSMTIAWPVQ
jgi:hypothetical protein